MISDPRDGGRRKAHRDPRQTSLWDAPVPHNKTDTSIAAAASQVDEIGTKRARVLELFRIGNYTCDEIEVMLGWSHQTVSARINDLHDKYARIEDSGVRRPTRAGRNAIVWRLTRL